MQRALGLAVCLSFPLCISIGCDKNDTATASPADPVAASEERPPAESPDTGIEASADDGGGTEVADDEDAADVDGGQTPPQTEPTEVASNSTDDAPDTKSEGPPPLPSPKYSKVDGSCGKDPGVGQKLKSFKLQSVDGKPMTNRSWGNRVLLVNFWGTWCKPCLKELPEFARLYRRYRKHGLVLVAIATDEDPEAVKSVLAKSKISAKVAIGGEAYAGKYNSPKFPFTFVVDPKGNIKSSYRGFEPKCMGKLEADIRAELEARNAK